jgi:hypothetical protein
MDVRGLARRSREEIAFMRKEYSRRDWANLGGFLLVCALAITSLVILAIRGDWDTVAIVLVLCFLIAAYERGKAAWGQ